MDLSIKIAVAVCFGVSLVFAFLEYKANEAKSTEQSITITKLKTIDSTSKIELDSFRIENRSLHKEHADSLKRYSDHTNEMLARFGLKTDSQKNEILKINGDKSAIPYLRLYAPPNKFVFNDNNWTVPIGIQNSGNTPATNIDFKWRTICASNGVYQVIQEAGHDAWLNVKSLGVNETNYSEPYIEAHGDNTIDTLFYWVTSTYSSYLGKKYSFNTFVSVFGKVPELRFYDYKRNLNLYSYLKKIGCAK